MRKAVRAIVNGDESYVWVDVEDDGYNECQPCEDYLGEDEYPYGCYEDEFPVVESVGGQFPTINALVNSEWDTTLPVMTYDYDLDEAQREAEEEEARDPGGHLPPEGSFYHPDYGKIAAIPKPGDPIVVPYGAFVPEVQMTDAQFKALCEKYGPKSVASIPSTPAATTAASSGGLPVARGGGKRIANLRDPRLSLGVHPSLQCLVKSSTSGVSHGRVDPSVNPGSRDYGSGQSQDTDLTEKVVSGESEKNGDPMETCMGPLECLPSLGATGEEAESGTKVTPDSPGPSEICNCTSNTLQDLSLLHSSGVLATFSMDLTEGVNDSTKSEDLSLTGDLSFADLSGTAGFSTTSSWTIGRSGRR